MISPSGSGRAVSIDFIPNCGYKFMAVSFDTGVKIFDFETGAMLQSFPGLYTFLCDCIKFVQCPTIPTKPGEFLMITRGVELLNQENESMKISSIHLTARVVVKPNTCALRKLVFPEHGIGKMRLEEISTFKHPEYLWIFFFFLIVT